jgi:drug/metabolite transporter (DMT)-like permease
VIIFEEIDFSKIRLETIEILYAGILSGGAAFALQIFGQKNISSAPAAIVMSLEGVFAATAAWLVLDQVLGLNNIIGCFLILFGVIFSQVAPTFDKNYK